MDFHQQSDSLQQCLEAPAHACGRNGAKSGEFWQTSSWEFSRCNAILSSLQVRRYKNAFELGCCDGLMTELLAEICENVHAVESSLKLAAKAEERCKIHPHVHVGADRRLEAIPPVDFDLIVFREIGHYFTSNELQSVVAELANHLAPGGVFVAAHWTGFSTEHLLSCQKVHGLIGRMPQLALTSSARFQGFRIDYWTRTQ